MDEPKQSNDARPTILSDRLRLDFIKAVVEKNERWSLDLIKFAVKSEVSANELLLGATWQCNLTGVKWLLENMSIDVNWRSEKGNTALILAVSPKFPKVQRVFDMLEGSMLEGELDQKSADIIQELRRVGANPTIRNNEGKSALEMAYNREIRKALNGELRDAKPVKARITGV